MINYFVEENPTYVKPQVIDGKTEYTAIKPESSWWRSVLTSQALSGLDAAK